MRVVTAETDASRHAPVPARPMAQVLIEESAGGGRLAATQVVIPPGGGMPQHDHGDSPALVVPLAGELVMSSGSQQERVTPGSVVLLDRGERVALANRTDEPVTVITVFATSSASTDVGSVTTSSAGTPDPADGSQWLSAGPLTQLDDDTAVHVDVGGYPVCLARSRGSVHALRDECSHERVALSEGDVEDGQVECWLHGSRFDLSTGAPTGPPATGPVPVYPVRVIGDGIEVAVPASRENTSPG